MKSVSFLLSVMFAAILSGCAGGADEKATVPSLDGDVQFDDTTGSVRGVVLDENQLPVEGATVELHEAGVHEALASAVTDQTGAYVLNFVPPGEYMLVVYALGYTDAHKDVAVRVGQVTEAVDVVLSVGVSSAPRLYIDQQRRIVGHLTWKLTPDCMYINQPPLDPGTTKTCGGGLGMPDVGPVQGIGGCGPGSCCVDYLGLLENDTQWDTMVGEVQWTPSTSVTGRGFLWEIIGPNTTGGRCGGVNQNDHRDWVLVDDQPPLRHWIDDAGLEARGVAPEDRCCDWRWRIFSGWCDLGNCNDKTGPDYSIPTEQPVDIYYSIFWRQTPPSEYTAAPEE